MLPFSVPGSIIALGVILTWSGKFDINICNTVWIILVAYIARCMAFSFKANSASLDQVHGSLVERRTYLDEVVDYGIRVGEQHLRVQKGRRAASYAEDESCSLVFYPTILVPVLNCRSMYGSSRCLRR